MGRCFMENGQGSLSGAVTFKHSPEWSEKDGHKDGDGEVGAGRGDQK